MDLESLPGPVQPSQVASTSAIQLDRRNSPIIQLDDVQPDLFSRNPPVIQPDSQLQPPQNHNTFVEVFHPVILGPFPILAAYDYDTPAQVWGVHHNTAITALAGNRKGHLTSYDRDRKTTPSKQQDDILLAGQYYRFLDDFLPTKNYSICTEFRRWPFPDAVPAAWDTVPSVPQFARSHFGCSERP